MKIRIFKQLVDGVFNVRVQTEDWSENDKDLMKKFGEPEFNLGGTFSYDPGESSSASSSSSAEIRLDDVYARIMTESPFVRKFDSRDLGSLEAAKALANAWSIAIEGRISGKVIELRSKDTVFTTEEITEY